MHIQEKTLKDIEFYTVLSQMAAYCITHLGTEKALAIAPLPKKEAILSALHLTNEYLASFENDNRIPNHGFEPITKEIQLLRIENSFLETASFKKIKAISASSNEIINFFKKFKEYYPHLADFSANINVTTAIINEIDNIIDRFGDVKDNATPTLFDLRQRINAIRGKINQSFASALTTYSGLDYLDDIRESVIENKRVLAVKAMYRRKVKGSILGGSKTGSIVYIEPETTFRYTRELNN